MNKIPKTYRLSKLTELKLKYICKVIDATETKAVETAIFNYYATLVEDFGILPTTKELIAELTLTRNNTPNTK